MKIKLATCTVDVDENTSKQDIEKACKLVTMRPLKDANWRIRLVSRPVLRQLRSDSRALER